MTVAECNTMFQDFASKAFRKRLGMQLPGLRMLVEATHQSQYKSQGLNASLVKAFGQRKMFGEIEPDHEDRKPKRVKVAITTSTVSTSTMRGCVVGNYNRNGKFQCKFNFAWLTLQGYGASYEFLRAEDTKAEMAVWEA